MKPPPDCGAIVSVDLGAQSCRISLLRWSAGHPRIELVHRISNAPVLRDGQLRWNLAALCEAADEGLRRCAAIAEEGIASIGVTGWAVDYVRLNPQAENGTPSDPIADPFCYRDPRNSAALENLHQRISPERLYALTGIQVLPINTLYQLYADRIAGVSNHLRWLNLPEYMLYRWGARPIAEYTNATHTGMVELGTMQWSREIFSTAEIDPATAPEIVPAGSIIGRLRAPFCDLPALRGTLLTAPACHDTASAIAGIDAGKDDANGNDWAYISSGTWSLVGTLLDHPCAGPESARLNFTNEGGVGGAICFLRNVNGLWLLQQSIAAWQAAGESCSLDDLIAAAQQLPPPEFLIDVDDADLIAPQDMPRSIAAQLRRKYGSAAMPSSPPALASLILHSLAARYATVLRQAASLTVKNFKRLYIVGGGSRNAFLNRLTQQATGLEIVLGEPESSTIGNFAVQLAALEAKSGASLGASFAPERSAVARWAAALAHLPHAQTNVQSRPSRVAHILQEGNS